MLIPAYLSRVSILWPSIYLPDALCFELRETRRISYDSVCLLKFPQAKRWEGVYSRNNATEHEQRKVCFQFSSYPFLF